VFSDLLAPLLLLLLLLLLPFTVTMGGVVYNFVRHICPAAVCLLAECQRTPVWPKRLCIKLGPQRGARGTCEATYGLNPAFTEWR
jgi:hypothetical protein